MKQTHKHGASAIFIVALALLILVVTFTPYLLPDRTNRIEIESLPDRQELLFVEDSQSLVLYPWEQYETNHLYAYSDLFPASAAMQTAELMVELLFYYCPDVQAVSAGELAQQLQYGVENDLVFLHDFPLQSQTGEALTYSCAMLGDMVVYFSVEGATEPDLTNAQLEELYQRYYPQTLEEASAPSTTAPVPSTTAPVLSTTAPGDAELSAPEDEIGFSSTQSALLAFIENNFLTQEFLSSNTGAFAPLAETLYAQTFALSLTDYRFVYENRVYTVYETDFCRLILIFDPAFSDSPFSGFSIQFL